MLETLKKIGDQFFEGRGVWARLVAEPKVDLVNNYYYDYNTIQFCGFNI